MLNFEKWKKLNENFGMLGGVLGGPVTPNSLGSPIAQGNIDTNSFRTLGDSYPENAPPKWMGTEIKMEDDMDDEADDDVDELEEIDMEDVEDEERDMEDEDMEDEDMEDKDMEDEDMEDEDMEDEDMEDEDMEDEKDHPKHHKHHKHHEEDNDEEKETCSKCGAMYMKKDNCMKCGSYMKEEGVSYSNIPSLEEWQKSVASMYDPKFFDKKFDGITMINEDIQISGSIMNVLSNLDKKLGTKSTPYYMQVIEEIFKKMLPKLNKNHASNLKTKIKNMLTQLEKVEQSATEE